MTPQRRLKAYINQNKARFLQELIAFLEIPSVGCVQKLWPEVSRAAELVQRQLQDAGAEHVELIKTPGHPLVYAEKRVGTHLPTVLVYGHYDVQPAEPLEGWKYPPFSPVVKAGKVYARGASDDKGQIYAHIKALESMLATDTLPCNVKFIIEGEEETGSVHIQEFLKETSNRDLLAADAVLVSDTPMIAKGHPSLQIGLRGIAALEVTLTGANRDVHSGVYGGAIANPIQVLCKLLAALKDDQERIAIPGFYDDVIPLSAKQRALMQETPFDLQHYKASLGIKNVAGEAGYTTLERGSIRPSLDIHGIWGGYTAEGIKTILPAKAHAKISMRLVPQQTPSRALKQCQDYLHTLVPPSVNLEIHLLAGKGDPLAIDPHTIALQAASKACIQVWGKAPLMQWEGGSIPIIARFKEALKADIVLMGFGLESDNIHAPNEHFVLNNFFKGIETVCAFYTHFTEHMR